MQTQTDIENRIANILGQRVVLVKPVQRGYTPALRWLVTLTDGRRCFAKIATNEMTATWLRLEQHSYATLAADFMPAWLGWEDHPTQPMLLLEDLSDAMWPPPWTARQLEALMRTLDQLWSSPTRGFPTAREHYAGVLHGWAEIAKNREPFLRLGVADSAWLDRYLPLLCSFDEAPALEGDDLLHGDLRSDNLCIRGDRAIVFDWNNTCIGNRRFDLAAMLPSIAHEGGPLPETFLPDAGVLTVILAGYFASRAGLPIIPQAPRVREVQLAQLKTALPWMCRTLRLPMAC